MSGAEYTYDASVTAAYKHNHRALNPPKYKDVTNEAEGIEVQFDGVGHLIRKEAE
jgi:hypothetical protein